MTTAYLEEGMTKLPDYLFKDCTNLKNIELLYSLTHIGAYSFAGCISLEEIIIPDAVLTVGDCAYNGCTALHTITMGQYVESIGAQSFAGCTALENVNLNNLLTQIGNSAFSGCTDLESIVIPDSVTEICAEAFYNCSALTDVILSANLKTLGNYAFRNCAALNEITIPKKLTSSGNSSYPVFKGCTSLATVYIEPGMTVIPPNLLRETTGLQTVHIPDSVVTIGHYAFYGSGIPSVVLPDSVREIQSSVFENCGNLQQIQMPEDIHTIGTSAFRNCDSLETIDLPDALTKIETYLFDDSDALIEIVIPDSVESIEGAAFRNCDELKDVVIGNRVTLIKDNAFYRCELLESVEFSDSIERIEDNVFYDCDALKTVTLGSGLQTIGTSCFYDCDALESVTMGDRVSSMGNSVFEHCDILKNVKLSISLTKIPNSAFKECGQLEEIVIPYYVTTLENKAFNRCPRLKKVVTYSNLISIGTEVFSYPNVTIFYGIEGSYVHQWTIDNGYQFVANTVPAESVTLPEQEIYLQAKNSITIIPHVEPFDFSEAIIFRSTNDSVFTVDALGKVIAVAPGTAVLEVVVGEVRDTCTIHVVGKPSSIKLDQTELELNLGARVQLNPTVSPVNENGWLLEWSSDNPRVATVVDGLVQADSENVGTAVISVRAKGTTSPVATCQVSVADLPDVIPVETVTLNQTEVVLNIQNTFQLTATVQPETATDKTVIWVSADKTVATVGKNGLITAVGLGSTTIRAEATDGSGVFAQCNVSVESATYTITYDANGGKEAPPSQTKIQGQPITLSEMVPENWSDMFLGWSTYPDCYGQAPEYKPGDTYTADGDATLYAVWTSAHCFEIKDWGIGIDFNFKDQYYLCGLTLSKSTKVCISSSGTTDTIVYLYDKDGNMLAFDDNGGNGNNFAITYRFEADTTYFFKIKLKNGATGKTIYYMDCMYDVIYDATGGTGAPASQIKKHGEPLTLRETAPTREGYTFLGWATAPNATKVEYRPCDSYEVDQDVTLYALWDSTGNALVSLSILALPLKLVYQLGEELDLSGMALLAEYADGSQYVYQENQFLEHWIVAGFDSSTPGEKTITVSFSNKTVAFTVTVNDEAEHEHNFENDVCTICGIIGGKCGDNLIWTLSDDGVLTISGNGEMYDFPDAGSPWYSLNSEIDHVVICEGVMNIGNYAFVSCGMDDIEIPDSVTRIGQGAFAFSRIESIQIPNGVAEIGDYAFTRSALKSVVLPEQLEVIGENAFAEIALNTIVLPNSLREIGAEAFWSTLLTNVTIPKNVSEIGAGAFAWCDELTSISVVADNANFASKNGILFDKNGTTLIQYPAKNTREIYAVPDGTAVIGEYAFSGVNTLKKVELPTDVSSLERCAFIGCSGLTEIEIPENVVSFGSGVFASCHALKTITFTGNAPNFVGNWIVAEMILTARYPVNNPTWTKEVMQNYGGTITWVPYGAVKNRITLDTAELMGQTSVWIDGKEYAVTQNGETSYVDLPDGNAKTMVVHTYHVGNAADVHTQYPVGMKVWMLTNENDYYTATRQEEFDNILQYSGMSIRVYGRKGIRMITSIEKNKKNALISDGLAGYTLKEYGTAIAWSKQLSGSRPLVLGRSYVKSNYAYKKGIADPVFKYTGNLMQYTNVLVNFENEQCKDDIAMRPYMILEDENGEQVTLYGGIVNRSIGYIAYQNRNVFEPGSDEYEYVWEIIHYVYGNIYDDDYKIVWSPPVM